MVDSRGRIECWGWTREKRGREKRGRERGRDVQNSWSEIWRGMCVSLARPLAYGKTRRKEGHARTTSTRESARRC